MFYPKTAEDFAILSESLRTPLVRISEDMLPLLSRRAKKYGVHLRVLAFDSVEADFLTAIREKLSSSIQVSRESASVKLRFPKTKARLAQKVSELLLRFYLQNLFDTHVSMSKGSAVNTITIKLSRISDKQPTWSAKMDHNWREAKRISVSQMREHRINNFIETVTAHMAEPIHKQTVATVPPVKYQYYMLGTQHGR